MYKAAVIRTFLILLIGLLALGTLTYAFDPLQQYRQATLYKPYFDEQRYLVPGIARTFDYDTVIVGTSVADNFILSHVNATLGARSAKLTMGGASAHEQHLVLGTALRTGKLKQVVMALDIAAYRGKPARLRYGPDTLPVYLYDDNRLNDFKYLWNLELLYKWSTRLFLSNAFGIRSSKLDKDKAFYWAGREPLGREHVRKYFRKLNSAFRPEQYTLDELKRSFEINLLSHVSQHPDVRFHIFLPPYALPYWSVLDNKGGMEAFMEFRSYVAQTLEAYPNATLYDFQHDMSIITDYDHYSNLIHYWPPVNRLIIEEIAAGRRVASHQSIPDNSAALLDAVRSFSEDSML